MKVVYFFSSDTLPLPDDLTPEELMTYTEPPHDFRFMEVDISDEDTIGLLIDKIHEHRGISANAQLLIDGEIHDFSCGYMNYNHDDEPESRPIFDLTKKISDFPKLGPNKEICIYVSNTFGLGN